MATSASTSHKFRNLMVRLCNFVRLALIGLAVVDGLDHKLGGHGRGTRRSSTAGDVPLWCARTMHIISCTSGFFKSDVGTPPIFPEPMGVHISSMCRLKALLHSSTAPKPNIAQYIYISSSYTLSTATTKFAFPFSDCTAFTIIGAAECHKEDVCHKKGGKHGNTYDCAKAIDLKDCTSFFVSPSLHRRRTALQEAWMYIRQHCKSLGCASPRSPQAALFVSGRNSVCLDVSCSSKILFPSISFC